MTPTQHLTDRKRKTIIQTTIAKFHTNSFDATNVDKITAQTKISKRTLYNHFASKDKLFTKILRVL